MNEEEELSNPLLKGDEEAGKTEQSPIIKDQYQYPGTMRQPDVSTPPSESLIFVKTGGNALQAIDRNSLDEDMITVTVPSDKSGGDSIMVDVVGTERFIPTTIPAYCVAGDTFLIRIPPEEEVVEVMEDNEIVAVNWLGKAGGKGFIVSKAMSQAPIF